MRKGQGVEYQTKKGVKFGVVVKIENNKVLLATDNGGVWVNIKTLKNERR